MADVKKTLKAQVPQIYEQVEVVESETSEKELVSVCKKYVELGKKSDSGKEQTMIEKAVKKFNRLNNVLSKIEDVNIPPLDYICPHKIEGLEYTIRLGFVNDAWIRIRCSNAMISSNTPDDKHSALAFLENIDTAIKYFIKQMNIEYDCTQKA